MYVCSCFTNVTQQPEVSFIPRYTILVYKPHTYVYIVVTCCVGICCIGTTNNYYYYYIWNDISMYIMSLDNLFTNFFFMDHSIQRIFPGTGCYLFRRKFFLLFPIWLLQYYIRANDINECNFRWTREKLLLGCVALI